MKKIFMATTLVLLVFSIACTTSKTPKNGDNHLEPGVDDKAFVNNLIASLTLEEKVGQMLQAEENHITPEEVRAYNIGSILSGGGSHPHAYDDDVDAWYAMVKTYQEAALSSSSKIPLLYGIDAVHGHNNVHGAVIFPHNINLGMANDPDLMRRIGEAVASEMKVTGIHWNFAPALSVVEDIRWGRSYEGFSEDARVHETLVAPYIEGLQQHNVLATAKHFIADGGTEHGIDQGNVVLDETAIRARHLSPFSRAVDADVQAVMISFSSIKGEKMHASKYWITDVLKEELGFEGIVLGDWNATFQLDGNFYDQMVTAINAGLDMIMLPQDWKEAHGLIVRAVENGDIDQTRIDDALKRILTVKQANGVFDDPFHRLDATAFFATDAHKNLAREAAAKSFVLLKNDDVLPLKGHENVYLTGPAHNHVGYLAGGWTTHWQGNTNADIGTGTSIAAAMNARLTSESGAVVSTMDAADTVVVVFAEKPYTEWYGDTEKPGLFTGLAHPLNAQAYQEALDAKAAGKTVIGVIVSGRPLLLENTPDTFDGLIAIFLPGSEGGNAFADVVYGDVDFSGRLSFTWPKDTTFFIKGKEDSASVLYPYGYGLSYKE